MYNIVQVWTGKSYYLEINSIDFTLLFHALWDHNVKY